MAASFAVIPAELIKVNLIGGAAHGPYDTLAVPEGYEPPAAEVARANQQGGRVLVCHDPQEAASGADVVSTDVWASMGQEDEMAERIEFFSAYQVNEELMAKTGKQTLFMHCLPAHRGQEVTDSVIESESSVVFQQAANRLPVEKAILVTCLGVGEPAEGASESRR